MKDKSFLEIDKMKEILKALDIELQIEARYESYYEPWVVFKYRGKTIIDMQTNFDNVKSGGVKEFGDSDVRKEVEDFQMKDNVENYLEIDKMKEILKVLDLELQIEARYESYYEPWVIFRYRDNTIIDMQTDFDNLKSGGVKEFGGSDVRRKVEDFQMRGIMEKNNEK